jgi:hypothetical protein
MWGRTRRRDARVFALAEAWLGLGAFFAVCAGLPACGGKDDPVTAIDQGPIDSGAPDVYVPPAPPPCPPENQFCNGGNVPPPEIVNTCGSKDIDLTPTGVNVMLAVDGSYAMRAHWPVVQTAIKKMLEANSDLNFGAHLFWANASNFEMVFEKINVCGSTENRVLDVAPNQHAAVLNYLGPKPPGPGGEYFSLRPVVDPLRYYLDNETKLANPKTTNYLVFISNGDDNCFGHIFAANQDKNITYEKLAFELLKKNIRTLPIGFDGATAQRTWDGKLMTNFESLDRLALNGGTGLKKALAADSAEQLEQALMKVSESVRSCRFKIPDALDPTKNLNPFELTFLVNNTPVPRDRMHAMGWDFVDGNTSEVEMFGDVCVALKAGKSIQAKQGCSGTMVCGTAATKLTAKDRAVEYLVDRSFSMAVCEKPEPLGIGLACIEDYGNTLSWWGKAARSVTLSLTAPINDDVEFALHYFPSKEDDACMVNAQPEVAFSKSSELGIIGSVLGTLATGGLLGNGGTPLVGALETVAMNPGRLADPNVTSAVILISDGANNCDGITQADAVARLGAAAKALRDRGIKVYAVRFGPKTGMDFADQEAQLRAIVTNGGTATGDPNDPNNVPYLDAPDQAQLDAVLTGVSEQLSTCDFEVSSSDKNADKDKVNLYINGEAIPFDQMGKKENGWGWLDAGRTTITMYGPACKRFKNSRSTSIVVEFGCNPIILL